MTRDVEGVGLYFYFFGVIIYQVIDNFVPLCGFLDNLKLLRSII